jgi:hypothetical protein
LAGLLVNGGTLIEDQLRTIGIVGADNIGGSFAIALGEAGIEAVVANSCGTDSVAGLVATFGGSIRTAMFKEAAAQEIVLAAFRWMSLLTSFPVRGLRRRSTISRLPNCRAICNWKAASASSFTEITTSGRRLR